MSLHIGNASLKAASVGIGLGIFFKKWVFLESFI